MDFSPTYKGVYGVEMSGDYKRKSDGSFSAVKPEWKTPDEKIYECSDWKAGQVMYMCVTACQFLSYEERAGSLTPKQIEMLRKIESLASRNNGKTVIDHFVLKLSEGIRRGIVTTKSEYDWKSEIERIMFGGDYKQLESKLDQVLIQEDC